MPKEIMLFDPEIGFHKINVPEHLENFPHLTNEAHVLGLTVLQEEDDDTYALGFDLLGGALSPWFDTLEELEKYCLEPGSREAMRRKKSLRSS